jgi:hypothetical protein
VTLMAMRVVMVATEMVPLPSMLAAVVVCGSPRCRASTAKTAKRPSTSTSLSTSTIQTGWQCCHRVLRVPKAVPLWPRSSVTRA